MVLGFCVVYRYFKQVFKASSVSKSIFQNVKHFNLQWQLNLQGTSQTPSSISTSTRNRETKQIFETTVDEIVCLSTFVMGKGSKLLENKKNNRFHIFHGICIFQKQTPLGSICPSQLHVRIPQAAAGVWAARAEASANRDLGKSSVTSMRLKPDLNAILDLNMT